MSVRSTRVASLSAVLAVFLLVGCSDPATDGAEASADARGLQTVPGALVVDFKDGTTEAEFDAWEKAWGVDVEFNSFLGEKTGITAATGVSDLEGALAKIRQHPAVEFAEPLFTYRTQFTPNDPHFTKQWNLALVNMPKAWDANRGKGVIVAVLDTGIAYEDHEDFRQVPDLKGVSFVEGYDFVNDDAHANDDHGHGTHVAGTIAQATNNKEGVAGVAFEAKLMPIKVLNHFGSGSSADITEAIRWAADHGAKVINLSLGGGGRSAVMEAAVAYARKKGVTVVAAAGNAGRGVVEFPAAYEGAVAVAAVGPDQQRAPYSSFGSALDLAAPGGNKSAFGEQGGIVQNTIDPRDVAKSVYASYQGTSMATPHVAGVAALLYAAGAEGPEEVEEALYAGARKVGDQAWSEEYGHGILDAEASLAALGRGAVEVRWPPFFWALSLLAVVLLSMRRRERPGFLNVLVAPAFLLPLVLSTVGFFVLRWFGTEGSDTLAAAALPIPDWEKWLFGRGRLANPLFYSALIPVLGALVAVPYKKARPVVAGLALGFAGMLGYTAWAGAPALAWLPFRALAMPWLVANLFVTLILARALISKDTAR